MSCARPEETKSKKKETKGKYDQSFFLFDYKQPLCDIHYFIESEAFPEEYEIS